MKVTVSARSTSAEMIRAVFFVAVMGLSLGHPEWEPCGLPSGCYCSRPVLHDIQCKNIKVFPIFEKDVKPGVLSISITNSQLVGLPPFKKEDWDRLKYLNFIDTPLLSCEEIAKQQRPGLRILSECISEQEEDCPECEERTTWLAVIIVLVFSCVGALSFILYLLTRYRQKSYTLKGTVPELPAHERETWV